MTLSSDQPPLAPVPSCSVPQADDPHGIICSIHAILFDWQVLITGVIALIAALLVVRATNKAADREIAAVRQQTRDARDLSRRERAAESHAFLAAMVAAVELVLKDIRSARQTYRNTKALSAPYTRRAGDARRHPRKQAFDEIRTASLRLGGQLTAPFLWLEREIDEFKSQVTAIHGSLGPDDPNQSFLGAEHELEEQLSSIEKLAVYIRDDAAQQMEALYPIFMDNEELTHSEKSDPAG